MLVNKLKYPKKSHRKMITLPRKSRKLAEFMGIIFGDGGINNDWQLTVTVNSIADKNYAQYIIKLGQELFNIKAIPRKRKDTKALVLRFSSINLVDFLVRMGAIRGNKIKQKFDMPFWIKGCRNFERAFVRGLIDTDGCLYIHKHSINGREYRNIGFCFSCYSKKLMHSTVEVLIKNNIKPYYARQMKCIYLYSKRAIKSYLSVFGTSNLRISNKYLEWKGA